MASFVKKQAVHLALRDLNKIRNLNLAEINRNGWTRYFFFTMEQEKNLNRKKIEKSRDIINLLWL